MTARDYCTLIQKYVEKKKEKKRLFMEGLFLRATFRILFPFFFFYAMFKEVGFIFLIEKRTVQCPPYVGRY